MSDTLKWIVGGIVGLLALAWLVDYSNYSSLNRGKNEVANALATVKTQEQRRGDLATQLIPIISAGMAQDRALADSTNAALKAMGSVQINANMSPDDVKRYVDASKQFDSAFSRLLAVSINYPAAKSIGLAVTAMAQTEGSENRIAVARIRFNERATAYNTCVTGYFCQYTARRNGFVALPYLDVPEKSRELPNFGAIKG